MATQTIAMTMTGATPGRAPWLPRAAWCAAVVKEGARPRETAHSLRHQCTPALCVSKFGVCMTNTTAVNTPARNAAVTMRYAKVWKAVVSGTVPTRRDDVEAWYRAARHVIGVCLHDAQLEAVLHDVDDAIVMPVSSAA